MKALTARVVTQDSGAVALASPTVGFFRPSIVSGKELSPGQLIGTLSVLGVPYAVRTPPGVEGTVAESAMGTAVDYATALVVVSTQDAQQAGRIDDAQRVAAGALFFCSPMSGRFYRQPAPGEPAFVNEGDEITAGTAIGLLEVMKTFNRLQYGGAGLPSRARIRRIVPADETDLLRGDPILELETIS